ncbi:MAG: energy-coupling factor transporter transmembrane component T [Cyanobacteria bacterium J06638_22]
MFAIPLNPFTKLTIALCAIALGFGMVGDGWAIGILLGVLLPWSAGMGILRPVLQRVFWAIAPLALFLIPIHGFFHPGTTILLTVDSFTVTQEGLAYAYRLLSRLTVLAAALLSFSLSTTPAELIAVLTQRGVSPALTYLLISPFQLIPEIRTKAATILAAQQARGMGTGGNLWQRGRALMPMVVPLVLGALVDAEERAMALEARAFRAGGRKTSLVQIPDAVAQHWLRWGLLGFTVVLVGWSQWQFFTSRI